MRVENRILIIVMRHQLAAHTKLQTDSLDMFHLLTQSGVTAQSVHRTSIGAQVMGRKPRSAQAAPSPPDEPVPDEGVTGEVSGAAERRDRRGGPRLTAAQRAEIVDALTRGEGGRALAERYG